MNKKRLTQLSIVLIFVLFSTLSSCLSIKPGGLRTKKNVVETFYVGEEGSQYFIKPLEFSSSVNDDILLIDYTFRFKNQIKDSVTVNFSIISAEVIRELGEFKHQSTSFEIVPENVSRMFSQKKKKDIESRFTGKLALKDLVTLFDSQEFKLVLEYSDQHHIFIPDKKTMKKLKVIDQNVFDLF